MNRWIYRWRSMTPIARLDYYAAAVTLLVVALSLIWLGRA